MIDNNRITDYLHQFYEEVEPVEFYRNIFPIGSFQDKGDYEKYLYNGIIVEITDEKTKNGKNKILRHTVTDDLEIISDVITRDNFCIMSMVDYVGKRRDTENARNLYALVIEIDNLIVRDDTLWGMSNLFHQFENDFTPTPTYIISSGNGVHLYYVFDEPIKLYKNVLAQFEELKRALTYRLWNDGVTTLVGDDIQYEPVCQGFRMVGSITRKKTRARAFETGKNVTVEYLNSFVPNAEHHVTEISYKSNLSLTQAKEKYPEWYEQRVIKKLPKGAWHLNSNLYYWWKEKMLEGAVCGHRYWSLWVLSVYAIKCSYYHEKKNPNPITREILEKDCFYFLDILDERTQGDFDSFTKSDVLSALEGFDSAWVTFPIDKIIYRTGIRFEKNKRNGRSQKQHIKFMNGIKSLKRTMGEEVKDGRPKGSGTAEQRVREWQEQNPTKRKADCHRETGLDPKTIRKWWG